ncbi:MAG: 2-amino-4-hydroxy-6-hydroxymethyldihydropteridine diphosphokinase [Deltaproteobacteria bacterium]|nr:2-amino-4-hydroxy-6-hydroxymethyldihydropteridine diphosphokinase [Deltaproteobacteria bacterium]MBW2339071.1 2-amino-4-hydroxy-6-hydroxymethyldihydropteridine diphosphokinase [Deltaproteobacteria bacterium]
MTVELSTVYVGVGSNLGDKLHNCTTSLQKINQLPGCEVTACSDIIKTEPEGVTGQDWYANCVAEIKTTRTPFQFLKDLLAIEYDMGRVRTKRWESRIIDLDILLFGQAIMESDNLTIPHRLLHKRRFVLEPLVQLAPDLVHPVLNVSIRQLFNELPKESSAEVLKEET